MEGDGREALLKVAENGRNEEDMKTKLWRENKKMWVVAGPAIFTRFSTFGINVISQAFVGHIGSTELAAYALVFTLLTRFANGLLVNFYSLSLSIFDMFYEIITFCSACACDLGIGDGECKIGFIDAGNPSKLLETQSDIFRDLELQLGAASGLETLCGQAYGARQYHMLGIYLQRSWIVLTVLATLQVPVYVFATPILIALGQDEVVAQEAGNIALWFIPVTYSFVISFTCQMYLQAQSKNMIITYLAVLSLTIHIFLSWLLIVKFQLGIPGAMCSTILAYWIPNLGQLIFVTSGGCPETWKGLSTLAFKDLWPVVKLSLSSGAMLCLELWYSAILILLTGNLKNATVAVDALSICLNINGWEMMISLGFLAAASVRVSNELGKGNPRAAKTSIANVVSISLVIGVVLFAFFLFFRERLAYVFTEDTDVAAEVAHLSPLLAFSILMNSVQPVLSGVAVGAGWQSIVVYVNLGCYYLIGIPFGLLLGYVVNLQVEGVWIGMLMGTFIQTIVLMIITFRTDWEKQVSVARKRVNRWFVEDRTSSDQQA